MDEDIHEFEAENTLQLTGEQKNAVWLAMTQRFGIIQGGAGTGKTTMLRAVHHAMLKHDGTVHAVALAGRAAMRMREATGYPGRGGDGEVVALLFSAFNRSSMAFPSARVSSSRGMIGQSWES